MGVWIETLYWRLALCNLLVTPCVGVWIETCFWGYHCQEGRSHPAWVCGLKLFVFVIRKAAILQVTPCVGVWIETENQQKPYTTLWVTPCVGVWIETENILYDFLLS